MKLMDYVKQINASITDVASKEKAKKIRKKLIQWGIALTVIGGVLTLAMFITFGLVASNMVTSGSSFSFTPVILPMIGFMLGGVLLSVGTVVLKAGLAILIGGETSAFIDRHTSQRCECGNTITSDQSFCPKCGRPVRAKCPECGNMLEPNDVYCRKCGHKVR